MANVAFKRGTQAALNAMTSYIEGSFYLTSDTDKLYFAQSANELVNLTQSIIVLSGSNLPTLQNTPTLAVGDIYYLQGSNVLAIVSATSPTLKWTQINPDTTLTTGKNNKMFTVAGDATNNKATLTSIVADTQGNSYLGTYAVKGGDNVHVSVVDNEVVISSDNDTTDHQYTISTATSAVAQGGKVVLKSSVAGDPEQTVTIKGSGIANVSSDNAGNVTVNVPSRPITSVTETFDKNGALVVSVGTADGSKAATTTVTPTIKYGSTGGSSATFNSGEATLDVYTKDEVDTALTTKLQEFDAMTYQGVLSPANATKVLVTDRAKANAGDTYKAGGAINNVGGISAKAGDLIIAAGSDGDPKWEVVPSGDDQLISVDAQNNAILIKDNSTTLGGIQVQTKSDDADRAKITVSGKVTNKITTLTLAHGDAGTGTAVTINAYNKDTTGSTMTKATNTTSTFDIPVLTGLSKDAAGHVTDVSSKTFRVIDSHANINAVTAGIGETKSDVTPITIAVSDTDNQSRTGSFYVKTAGGSLSINQTTSIYNGSNVDVLNFALEWGTF